MNEREIRIDGENLRITFPIQMRRVAGRKLVILADGNGYGDSEGIPGPRAVKRGEMGSKGRKQNQVPTPQDRALREEAVRTALAIRWVGLLEDGKFTSMSELARAVSFDPSAMARLVRRADGKIKVLHFHSAVISTPCDSP